MFQHGPTCPEGPVSLHRCCWREDAAPAALADEPEIRTELVLRIRREIAEGTYDTPEKMEIALERLFDHFS